MQKQTNGKMPSAPKYMGGNIPTIDYGQPLPHDNKLEMAVLGALMVDNKAIHQFYGHIHAPIFYNDQNRIIWDAINELYSQRIAIDLLTVCNQIKKMGKHEIVTPYDVTERTNIVASAANLEFHILILKQKWLRRAMIRSGRYYAAMAYRETHDVFDLFDEMQNAIMGISRVLTAAKMQHLDDLLDELEHQLFSPHASVDGLSTYLHELDGLLGMLRSGGVYMVGGRPGSGKTTITLQIAADNARNNVPVGFLSYEQPSLEIIKKIISSESEIDSTRMSEILSKKEEHKPLEEWEERILRAAMDKWREIKHNFIITDDVFNLDANGIRAKALQWSFEYGIKLLVIDYLQLVPDLPHMRKANNKANSIVETMRILKGVAKECGIAIICLSQLSKDVEKKRPFCRPILSDFRDSGGAEDTADGAIFVWRPDYHGYPEIERKRKPQNGQPNFGDDNGEMFSTVGKACLIVAKHRHGKTGDEWFKFSGGISKFESLEDDVFAELENKQDSIKVHLAIDGSGVNVKSSNFQFTNNFNSGGDNTKRDDVPF